MLRGGRFSRSARRLSEVAEYRMCHAFRGWRASRLDRLRTTWAARSRWPSDGMAGGGPCSGLQIPAQAAGAFRRFRALRGMPARRLGAMWSSAGMAGAGRFSWSGQAHPSTAFLAGLLAAASPLVKTPRGRSPSTGLDTDGGRNGSPMRVVRRTDSWACRAHPRLRVWRSGSWSPTPTVTR